MFPEEMKFTKILGHVDMLRLRLETRGPENNLDMKKT